MSWEEDAAFRRLLDTYYTTEKALPADLRAVCRLVLATTESQREAVKQVLGEFFELLPCGWVNHRADAEIAEMQERQHMAKAKANKRWDMQRAAHSKAAAQETDAAAYAAAQKTDADAMLPTPTPTPTPVLKNTSAIAPPDGVELSVWADFVALRKDKKAKLTQTAVDGIRREADKAKWPLEAALRECCSRGWTGFKADWVADKPRDSPNGETAYQRSMREKYEQIAPSIAAKAPGIRTQNPNQFFDTLPTVKPLEITNA